MEERKIGTDGACFLVKDVSLKQEWDCPIYAWLRERGFRSWGRKGTYLGVDWVFININSKIFAPGMPGVQITRPIGQHAITFEEFKIIYNIFEKYNALPPLQMERNEEQNCNDV